MQGTTRCILLLAILISAGAAAGATTWEPKGPVDHPVFGFSYKAAVAQFQEVPEHVGRACGCCSASSGRWWIFAHQRIGAADLYIVTGLEREQEGDIFGSALLVEGATCRTVEALHLLSGKVPAQGYPAAAPGPQAPGFDAPERSDGKGSSSWELRSPAEEASLRALIKDAIEKGIKAFGSVDAFKRRACTEEMVKGDERTPIVNQQLRAFCGSRAFVH